MSAPATFGRQQFSADAAFGAFLRRRLHNDFDHMIAAPMPDILRRALNIASAPLTSGEGLPAAHGLACGLLASAPLWGLVAWGVMSLAR